MSSTKVFIPAISTGERLTAAKINGLDTAQYNSLTRNENVALLDDAGFDLAAFDFLILGSGAGKFKPDGAYTEFQGYPTVDSSAGAVTDYVPPCDMVPSDGTVWLPKGHYWEANAAGSNFIYFLLSLPVGIVINTVKVLLLNPTAVSLPTNLPVLQLGRQAVASTSSTVIATATDAPVNVAAYNAAHELSLTSVAHTVQAGYRYYAVLQNEYGGTSSAGLRAYRPHLTVTVSTIRAI